MDAQKSMKIVYDELKKAKDFSAEGTDIMISPKDFKDVLSGTELWRTVQKMSKDYDLFSITLAPDAIIAHQYDDIADIFKPHEEHKHKYLLHLNDNFEGFPTKILKEASPIAELPDYLPYYIQLMLRAIDELNIDDGNQPAKKEIEAWFEESDPSLSKNDISSLSTFVRQPHKKKGGWHSNTKKD